MRKFLVSECSILPKFILFKQKNFFVGGLILTLHILIILFLIQSFNKLVPFQSEVSKSGGKIIEARFLSKIPPLATVSTKEVQAQPSHVKEQEKTKLLVSTSAQKEIKQANHSSLEPEQQKLLTVQKTQPLTTKIKEESNPSTQAIQKTDSINKDQSKDTATASNATEISAEKLSIQSSQSNKVALTASQEKSITTSPSFKALNRRMNYPTRARSLGVEGRVRVQFDITSSGTLSNIRILSENPVGVFSDAVIKDMARWRYQTTSEVKNQVVNIVFKLDGRVVLDN